MYMYIHDLHSVPYHSELGWPVACGYRIHVYGIHVYACTCTQHKACAFRLYLELTVLCCEGVDDRSDLTEGGFVVSQLLVSLLQEGEIVLKVSLKVRELLLLPQQLMADTWREGWQEGLAWERIVNTDIPQ